jgi:type II secretory pathway pseudopilin PulG
MRPLFARLEEEDGSILIESIVALAILSLTLTASLSSFADGIRRLQQAEKRVLVLAEARNLIAQASGADFLAGGVAEGEDGLGLRWRLTVEEKQGGAAGRARLFFISAAVRSEDGSETLVMLRTLVVSARKDE